MSVALASAVLFSCLGPLSVLGSAWSPSNAITSVKTTRAGSGCAFGFMLLQVRDPLQGGRLPPQARTGARRAVCLNNERNRPKESDRFCLPRSPLEGKFVPVNERMTFQAEMKALDALDEAEKAQALQPTEDLQQKFDAKGDVTYGIRFEVEREFSKKSVEARERWRDPEYRENVIRNRKRVARKDADAAMQRSKKASEPKTRRLPRLHDLLHSDVIAWAPEGGGLSGWYSASESTSGERSSSRLHESSTYTAVLSERERLGAGASSGGEGSSGARGMKTVPSEWSEGTRRKVYNLKLLRQNQNEWMAQRLGTDSDAPAQRAMRGTLEWRLEKQARYKMAARKRVEAQRLKAEREELETLADTTKSPEGSR